MTAQTGRTVSKYTKLRIGDTGGTLRDININTISVLGVKYDEQDTTAWNDGIKSALSNLGDAPIDFGGEFDTSVAAAVGTLSGSHTILNAINGDNTAHPLGIYIGIRHAWEAGEPIFGVWGASPNGYSITSYTVDPTNMTYAATARLFPGSAIPTWSDTDVTT